MNIYRTIILSLVFAALPLMKMKGEESSFNRGGLQVDASGRYLQHADGTPFLYLGDTAWELLARLTYEEAVSYLQNRKEKGFTVIQTVILSELESYDTYDVTNPDTVYLAHVDRIVEEAVRLGLYIGLLPTWGDKVDKQWGRGPELFNPENARIYGNLLGERYAAYPNIIWIIGGDRSGEGKNRAIWNAMAGGIREKDPHHLISYHPHGEHSSSFWFHDEPWLDFNMFQTGHCQTTYGIYRRLLWPDRERQPVKPVLESEPRYEDIPVNFREEEGRFTAYDVRKTLYQSMLSGTCGYTYGNNNIWQMYAPGKEPVCNARTWWYDALDSEGCNQLKYFYRLWTQFPFPEGTPCPEVLISSGGYTADEGVAFGNDSYLLCYFPGGEKWIIESGKNWNTAYTLQWMNPRTGEITEAGTAQESRLEINLPEPGTKNDWILIIMKK
ncbi:MAG: glycoside hydrolase family 140 protein [Tannerellaceae bacterium]|nr:glycoside hydrolase family 140 protein [Tannerellaceae bacterium]